MQGGIFFIPFEKEILCYERQLIHFSLDTVSSDNALTLYHIIPTFNDPGKKPFQNMVGKGENAFPTMFSTLPKTNFNFSVMFILSSSIAFNLD